MFCVLCIISLFTAKWSICFLSVRYAQPHIELFNWRPICISRFLVFVFRVQDRSFFPLNIGLFHIFLCLSLEKKNCIIVVYLKKDLY